MNRLPITILAGLSSTLREQVVDTALSQQPQLAAIVYELQPTLEGLAVTRRVVDAQGVQGREVVEVVSCCLACTVRADVVPAVELVTAAERWSQVLLVLPSTISPGLLTAAFRSHEDVRVDTVAVVVDALLLEEHAASGDLLADRGLAAAPTDRRSTADLLLGQIEDADVLAVVGLHRLATEDAQKAQALLAHLAPLALQVPLAPDGTGAADIVGTGRHDEHGTPAERERLAALAVELCPPACGVTTVAWSTEGALHPRRLREALEDLIAGVVRSRGEISLFGRPGQRIRWESAGQGLWFGDPVQHAGPARCSLVLTGIGLDAHRVRAALTACLATYEEVEDFDERDPFADALGPVRMDGT